MHSQHALVLLVHPFMAKDTLRCFEARAEVKRISCLGLPRRAFSLRTHRQCTAVRAEEIESGDKCAINFEMLGGRNSRVAFRQLSQLTHFNLEIREKSSF